MPRRVYKSEMRGSPTALLVRRSDFGARAPMHRLARSLTDRPPVACHVATPPRSSRAVSQSSAGVRVAVAHPRTAWLTGDADGGNTAGTSVSVHHHGRVRAVNADGAEKGVGWRLGFRVDGGGMKATEGIGRRAALARGAGGALLCLGWPASDAAAVEDAIDVLNGERRDEVGFPDGAGVDEVPDGTDDAGFDAVVKREEGDGGDPWEGSYVKPALTVPQYLDKVRVSKDQPPGAALSRVSSLPIRPGRPRSIDHFRRMHSPGDSIARASE